MGLAGATAAVSFVSGCGICVFWRRSGWCEVFFSLLELFVYSTKIRWLWLPKNEPGNCKSTRQSFSMLNFFQRQGEAPHTLLSHTHATKPTAAVKRGDAPSGVSRSWVRNELGLCLSPSHVWSFMFLVSGVIMIRHGN